MAESYHIAGDCHMAEDYYMAEDCYIVAGLEVGDCIEDHMFERDMAEGCHIVEG